MKIVVRWLSVFLCLGGWQTLQAADIRTSDSEHCAFEIVGEIVPGDYLRFAKLIDHNQLDGTSTRGTSLCLQSPGGAFKDAIGIGEVLYARGISTVITDGSECYSACALIFMAGTMHGRGQPYRMLSAGGILGFHAPYLRLKGGEYPRKEVERLSQEMRGATLALVKMASRQTRMSANDFIRLSLVVRILETDPTNVLYVKTIADATRWGIEIFDARDHFPKPETVDEVKNLCNNFHDANMDTAPVTRDLAIDVDKYFSRFYSDETRFIMRDARTKEIICEIYPRVWKGSTDLHFSLCSYDYWSSKSFGDCREYKETFIFGKPVSDDFRFAPETRLKKVP